MSMQDFIGTAAGISQIVIAGALVVMAIAYLARH